MLAPIVLFVYNRPEHTFKTLNALSDNVLADDSVLYIYSDGPKEDAKQDVQLKILETREVIRSRQWCKEVYFIESEVNKGLASSIISGVTEVVNRHGKVIVLEDDMITSPGFLKYMNDALDLYEFEERVMHISGFLPHTTGSKKLPETFFLRFMSCWGWATWKRSWSMLQTDTHLLHNEIIKMPDFRAFDLEGSVNIFEQLELNANNIINTWAIKWYSTIFLKNGLCLYPNKSLLQQIGLDGTGLHCGTDSSGKFDVSLATRVSVNQIKIQESKQGKRYLKNFYVFGRDSSIRNQIRFYLNRHFLSSKITV